MTGHGKILREGPPHQALLRSFASATHNDGLVAVVYPLGFITDTDGKRCECAECVEHRGQGPYCLVPE